MFWERVAGVGEGSSELDPWEPQTQAAPHTARGRGDLHGLGEEMASRIAVAPFVFISDFDGQGGNVPAGQGNFNNDDDQ